MLKTKAILTLAAMLGAFILSGQSVSEGVDTTSRGYRIGYQIGAYLPVAIILFLGLLIIWRSYRLGRQNPEDLS